ncbi:hypothetical protein CTAYLR_006325 [Chrysophaeum taylorii]|uniref:Uncharacterized protein n=1 Tax=Chrysophaeum taylorii TaxID=2483200 RepID=A0AAD7U9X2_9STRA|nr:hypothetical protein CTAYLR_006325 [Chrysophaeum taylorii]
MRVFEKSLASIVRHVVDAEAVWVVSRSNAAVSAAIDRTNDGRVRWLDETGTFPFNYTSIRRALEVRSVRTGSETYAYAVGWYLQQLIKLYCGRAINGWDALPDADTLVIDSDVVFFRDVAFAERSRREERCATTYRYAFSREHHAAYAQTNAKLLGFEHPSPRPLSGVAHHMVFRADVVASIERAVARRHGLPIWAALLDPDRGILEKPQANTFSEYQLYFHFAGHKFPDSILVRQLYWANGPGPRSVVECSSIDRWPDAKIRPAKHDADAIEVDARAGYDFVAYHSYAKRRNCVYAPYQDTGVCFGPGCTYSCFKRRDESKYKRLDRSIVAPRLCADASSSL